LTTAPNLGNTDTAILIEHKSNGRSQELTGLQEESWCRLL